MRIIFVIIKIIDFFIKNAILNVNVLKKNLYLAR